MKNIFVVVLTLIFFTGYLSATAGAFIIESVEYDPYFKQGDTVNLDIEVKNDDSYEIWTHATIKDPNSFGGEITKTEYIGAGENYTFHFSFELNKESDYLGDVWVSDAMGDKEVTDTFRFILSDVQGGSKIQVTDLDTGEPIQGALVKITKYLCESIEDEHGTTKICEEIELTEEGNTNPDGYYYTNLSYPGCYVFSASKEGYNCENNCSSAGGDISYSKLFDVSLELNNNSSQDNSNLDNNSGDDVEQNNDTPGFTLLILIASIGFILLIKRKKLN